MENAELGNAGDLLKLSVVKKGPILRDLCLEMLAKLTLLVAKIRSENDFVFALKHKHRVTASSHKALCTYYK